jgi:hypothetical protein
LEAQSVTRRARVVSLFWGGAGLGVLDSYFGDGVVHDRIHYRLVGVFIKHEPMKEAMVQVVVCVLSKLIVLDLHRAFRCLLVSNEVHEVTLCQSLLVLHVVTDSLNRSEIAEIPVFGERSCKSALTSVKELWVRQRVLVLSTSDQSCGRSHLHKLLAKCSNLVFVN